jgi:hypothetical protein
VLVIAPLILNTLTTVVEFELSWIIKYPRLVVVVESPHCVMNALTACTAVLEI